MCTYNGYYTSFDERERGSLEAGKVADMAVLSDDPYTIPREALQNLKVERLYLAGKPYASSRENILKAAMRGMTSKAKA